jgi:hypothetical protein
MKPFFPGLFFTLENFTGKFLRLKNFRTGFLGFEKNFARNFSREKFLSGKIFGNKKIFSVKISRAGKTAHAGDTHL